ncbi:MAG: amidinotransferase [Flavobacteriales bacterium]|nr:amidinotransferase [Flavobacteriales bacterium]MBL6873625.1 amidinotransferase [Flavobacteriales bacterium]
MLEINVHNETSKLEAVVLGLPDDFGGTPKLEDCYDPKSREYVAKGLFPTQESITNEMNAVLEVFNKYAVKVYRPENIADLNQIFSRDIGFVIEDKFIVPNIISDRLKEIDALNYLHRQIGEEGIVRMPQNTRVEGGDVMLCNEYVFVGYSEAEDFEKYQVARTNKASIDFLQATFPNKQLKGFELKKSDINPKENALHLDCCFQPIGRHSAIVYKGGFKNTSDVDFLINYFGEDNIIFISQDEMYQMNSNVFSISPEVIVSEKGFSRLNNELRKRGFTVEEVPYVEISKMEGLLRCSTLPLRRK